VAKLPTTGTAVMATLVRRLHPEFAGTSSMAEGTPNLTLGELVLMKKDNTTTLQWPTAVIQKTRHGKNGYVRVVNFKAPREYLKALNPKFVPYRVVNET